ncbi:hypothetical protein GCM10023219_23920 [Stakelama sediminis]|uniref:histidine kinase n=1 Tax=Stakelama sediminis TaxID=463200 RepID=A0A840YYR3_9SPHN|nr:HAMP domain-containing sensor histidine kinase [Stakelama sediminis]MBB5718931.1 signal transduction histidine kinase [Stakelama sediminis]
MDFRRAGWPLGRIVMIALLPVLGGVVALAWWHAFYANAVLAALIALWAIGSIAMSMRRDREPIYVDMRTDQRAMDAERQQRRLSAYLNLSPAPLILLEEGYRLRAVNRAARRLFSVQDIIPDPDPALIRAIAGTAPGAAASLRIDFGGGVEGYAIATADIAGDGAISRIAALVGIEAELRAAEARALRDLLNILSHEIMNGLTPIASLGRSAVELIESGAPADIVEARNAIETVARRAEGLRGFGEAYRRLARLPEPVMRSVVLDSLIADLTTLFRNRWPQIELAVRDDGAPNRVAADAEQLHIALWALLQNAAEACADRSSPRVVIEVRQVDRMLQIQVSDNGPGVFDDAQARIFQPFFTTKDDGSGVGLALVRMIALGHLGDVALIAKDGPGATFLLTLRSREEL